MALSVLGVPPSQIVIPGRMPRLAGAGADAADRRAGTAAARARIAALWPPGPYGLASASAKAVGAVFGRTRSVVSCFVAPEQSQGVRRRTAALPARLNLRGIERIALPELNGADRVALDNAMLL